MNKVVDWYLIFLASFMSLARATSNEHPEVRATAMVSTAEVLNIVTLLILFNKYTGPILSGIGISYMLVAFFIVMVSHHYLFLNNSRLKDTINSKTAKNVRAICAAIYTVGSYAIFAGVLFILAQA